MNIITNRYHLLLKLVESASEVFQVPDVDIIFKDTSKRSLCDVRDIICHIAIRVAHIEVTMAVLAQFTGRRHPSSIYNSIKKSDDLLFYDRDFKRKYNEVVNRYNEAIKLADHTGYTHEEHLQSKGQLQH